MASAVVAGLEPGTGHHHLHHRRLLLPAVALGQPQRALGAGHHLLRAAALKQQHQVGEQLAVQHFRAGAAGLRGGVAGDGEHVHRRVDARGHAGVALQQRLPARVFLGVHQHQAQAVAGGGGQRRIHPAFKAVAGHHALGFQHGGQQPQVVAVVLGEAVQYLHHAGGAVGVLGMRTAPAERDALPAQFVLAAQVALEQGLLDLPAVAEAELIGRVHAQEVVRRVAALVVPLHLEEGGQQAAGIGRQPPDQQPPAGVGGGGKPGVAEALDAAQHGGVVHGCPSDGPVSS
ncbi:hypothetical protein V8017_04895 [Stenotrophomonas rhizophila]